MISIETLDDYNKRANSLRELFSENLSKAKDLVVEDSPVDYITYEFVCLTYDCVIESAMLQIQFFIEGIKREIGKVNDATALEYIEKFYKMEKEIATQNELLEKLVSKHKARS